MHESKEEEFIGVLWLILTVLLYQNGIKGWWIATLIHGLRCIVFSVSYAYKHCLEKRRKKIAK